MLVSVLTGHNIIKSNSDFTSRPNCYFVFEFDDSKLMPLLQKLFHIFCCLKNIKLYKNTILSA